MQCNSTTLLVIIMGILAPCSKVQGFFRAAELPLKCKRPFSFGKCQSSVLRYYYNVKLKRCFMFIFSGCGDNENNFHSFRECYEECEKYEIPEYLINPDILKEFLLDYCEQPLDMGHCHSAFPRFYYDDRSRTCKPFNYTGCAGNRNNFDEEYECFWACAGNGNRDQGLDLARRPDPDVSPTSKEHFDSYYDVKSKMCRIFIYSGCKGNGKQL
ncbi:boophilin-G2-like [Podarcis muralis]